MGWEIKEVGWGGWEEKESVKGDGHGPSLGQATG